MSLFQEHKREMLSLQSGLELKSILGNQWIPLVAACDWIVAGLQIYRIDC